MDTKKLEAWASKSGQSVDELTAKYNEKHDKMMPHFVNITSSTK